MSYLEFLVKIYENTVKLPSNEIKRVWEEKFQGSNQRQLADVLDIAKEHEIKELDAAIQAARGIPSGERYKIPEGKQGECDLCGLWSGRLIKGACAPCRDTYNID